VVLTEGMGPQSSAVNTFNPPEGEAEFQVWCGGRSRKKVPKPWQQDVDMTDHD